MRNILRAFILGALVFVVIPLAAAPAFAQFREFNGEVNKIDKASKKKPKLIVDNRMGDKVSFIKVDETTVEDSTGKDKVEWDKLKKGDYVTVFWKFTDNPRKAYKVLVKPAPVEDVADDE